jgi:hypothetical protein
MKAYWLLIPLFLLSAFLFRGDSLMTTPSIQDVKKKHEAKLMSLPGVVSVGIGLDPGGRPAVIVGLDKSRPEVEAQLPSQLEGHPLVIQILGPIKAQ